MGTAVALVIVVGKSRRQVDRCQREMDELEG